ncbi:MAG: 30S ribosomal protein S4e [Candidatus Hodarchaeales archaeon]|jgi:small subunit ribosomal protein S4e
MGKKGAKRHQKRLAAPATYQLPRKAMKFTFHARNGAHSANEGIPLGIVLRDMWGVVGNRKELKYILNTKGVLIDGKPINDSRYIVGPMDIISLPSTNKHYRVIHWQGRRKLNIVEIDEEHSHWKLVRLRNKTIVKHGLTQLNCTSGLNILLKDKNDEDYDKNWDDPSNYSTKGTIKYDMKNHKVLDFYPFQEGSSVLVTSGVNTGKWGHLQHFEKRIGKNRSICIIKTPKDKQIITAMENLFVIGKDVQELYQYEHEEENRVVVEEN